MATRALVTILALRDRMFPIKSEASFRMVKPTYVPIFGGVASGATTAIGDAAELPAVVVLVARLTLQVEKMETPTPILRCCMTLCTQGCRMSTGERKPGFVMSRERKRGLLKGPLRVALLTVIPVLLGELASVIICMAVDTL
jgi:hypothetical protein